MAMRLQFCPGLSATSCRLTVVGRFRPIDSDQRIGYLIEWTLVRLEAVGDPGSRQAIRTMYLAAEETLFGSKA